MIRRLQLGAPVLPAGTDSIGSAAAASAPKARIAVLYTSGQFAVYDLDASNRLRPSPASIAACQRAGKAQVGQAGCWGGSVCVCEGGGESDPIQGRPH